MARLLSSDWWRWFRFQRWSLNWQLFGGAAFLVSVPVFVQAPLVRAFPWVGLAATLFWVVGALRLRAHMRTYVWGDLLLGFSWSWLAGGLYWGWLRWEPLLHLPIEAIGLPVAIWGLIAGWGVIGNCFYLGSLLGTTITDVYFYLVDLIPYWRRLMAEPSMADFILRDAVIQLHSLWAVSWGIVLASALLGISFWALRRPQPHWWAFAGAVITTILVDALFLVVGLLA
ncbi:MAG: DUF3120 domain-containing protein [Cyanobacteria bacterium P01_H01_bin.15]